MYDLVDFNTGEVEELNRNTISRVVSYTSTATNNYNAAVGAVRFEYTNNTQSGTISTWEASLTTSSSERYYNMFMEFIVSEFIDKVEVLGGKYYFRFKFISTEENVLDSDISPVREWYEFTYYKQIREDEISTGIEQSGSSIIITADIAEYVPITGMSTGLSQTILESGRGISTSKAGIMSGRRITATWNFNTSYADAFSATSYSSNEASKLTTQGYVSQANSGNIQAGINKFVLTFSQDGSNSQYNLLPLGFSIPLQLNFSVPQSLSPNVEVTYSTAIEGGGTWTDWHTRKVTCGTCGGDKIIEEDVTCSTCGGDGLRSCTACGGSGTLSVREISGYGDHSLAWKETVLGIKYKACTKCGASFFEDWFDGNECPNNPQYTTKKVECDRCNGSGKMACFACGTTGTITKTSNCTRCDSNGKVSSSYSTTEYYAKYTYIKNITAQFTNCNGAIASGNWNYSWQPSDSNYCTCKVRNTGTGSSTEFAQLSKIEFAHGSTSEYINTVDFSVTVRCKSGFESVFARPEYTDTLNISLTGSNDHYEAH